MRLERSSTSCRFTVNKACSLPLLQIARPLLTINSIVDVSTSPHKLNALQLLHTIRYYPWPLFSYAVLAVINFWVYASVSFETEVLTVHSDTCADIVSTTNSKSLISINTLVHQFPFLYSTSTGVQSTFVCNTQGRWCSHPQSTGRKHQSILMEFCRQPFLVLETISNLSKENRFRYIAPFVIFKLQTTQYVAHSLLNLVQIYSPFQTTLHSVDFYKIYMERSFGSRRFCFKFRFGYILFNIYIGSVGYHIVHPHHIWPSLLP